ncbi:MAG: delta-60 repeat domain-containing protein, partial [Prosthecobacter sp.]|nr:delta-60 repeat domain-containing protein [Prosthecobacter sp.]
LPNGHLIAGGSIIDPGQTGYCYLNPDGTFDTTVPWYGTSGMNQVFCVAVQSDGKILLGGNRSLYTPSRLWRLNTDGTADAAFQPNINGDVVSFAPFAKQQTAGSIIVAGNFTSVGGYAANYLASVTSYNGLANCFISTNPNSMVRSVSSRASGAVLIGGGFSTVGGVSKSGFALLWTGVASAETLTASPSTGVIEWNRSPTASDTLSVTFELSTDGGVTWDMLGSGTRVGDKWQFTYPLPPSGHICARARIIGGTYNGSSALVEKIISYGTP